jgi:hypothetical protein
VDAGAAAGRAEVVFRNQLSAPVRLVIAQFELDGIILYSKESEKALRDKKTILVCAGSIGVGDHKLQSRMKLRGYGYLESYWYLPRSSHSFTVNEATSMHIEIVAYEKASTAAFHDRLAVRYAETIVPNDAGTPDGEVAIADGATSVTDGGTSEPNQFR